MSVRFRHLDLDLDADASVDTWPAEGVITALERGSLSDWGRIAQAVRADPWGPVARRVTALVEASALSHNAFAEAIGTSASRLSTYVTGRVAPSSTLLVRMERVARGPDAVDPSSTRKEHLAPWNPSDGQIQPPDPVI